MYNNNKELLMKWGLLLTGEEGEIMEEDSDPIEPIQNEVEGQKVDNNVDFYAHEPEYFLSTPINEEIVIDDDEGEFYQFINNYEHPM